MVGVHWLAELHGRAAFHARACAADHLSVPLALDRAVHGARDVGYGRVYDRVLTERSSRATINGGSGADKTVSAFKTCGGTHIGTLRVTVYGRRDSAWDTECGRRAVWMDLWT